MRTGLEYRESLRDGRDVWVMGEGQVEDITTHPATSAMVLEYEKWYDRHFDPAWEDSLLTNSDGATESEPLAFEVPTTSAQLQRQGEAIRAVLFACGGNITHTPGYGALIALGLLNHLKALNKSSVEIAAAGEYLESIAHTGRFLTFAGGGPLIGPRLRLDPTAIRLGGGLSRGSLSAVKCKCIRARHSRKMF